MAIAPKPVAYGILVGTGTPAFTAQVGFSSTVTDNGTGDFQVTLDEALDSAECIFTYGVVGTTGAAVTVVHTSDTSKQILVKDLATPSAVDLTVYLKFERIPKT